MEEEGILAGISSGAAVAAALKLQEDESFTNKNIVVILPSSGELPFEHRAYSPISLLEKESNSDASIKKTRVKAPFWVLFVACFKLSPHLGIDSPCRNWHLTRLTLF